MTPDLDRLAIDTIRTLSIDAVQQANSGHPGAPMGAAPMAYVLWTRFLRHAPTHPDWPDRDRFVLSAGHASMLLYSLLHLTGYDLPARGPQAVPPVGQPHARAPRVRADAGRRGDDRPARPGLRERGRDGHRRAPARGRVQPPGRTPSSTTGPTSSPPTATSRRASRPRRRASPATCGSGKLVVLYDDNHIQLDGPTSMAWSEDVLDALRRLRLAHPARRGRQRPRRDRGGDRGGPGRRPAEPHRGPDAHRLRQPEQAGQPEGARLPARSGRGPADQGGLRLGPGQDVLRPGRGARASSARRSPTGERAGRGMGRRASTPTPRRIPDLAAEFRRRLGGRAARRAGTPTSRRTRPGPRSPRGTPARTRSRRSRRTLPELFGGAADLSESNLTDVKGEPNFSADEPGRNLRFGVREHAMGGIANGIAYHGGFIPYVRHVPQVQRLHARLGPAGRAVRAPRHLRLDARLGRARRGRPDPPAGRALRGAPRDPEPVVHAARATRTRRRRRGRWRSSGTDGPVALALTRQKLPDAGRARPRRPRGRRAAAATSCARRPAATPQLILIGTGSELQLAFAAAEAARGATASPTRVVSLPCWERFDAQDQAYRDAVLPPAVRKRVSVEVGVSLGWERWVGDEGAIIGLDHFGASAPAGTIFEHFGFTADRVADVARKVVRDGLRGRIPTLDGGHSAGRTRPIGTRRPGRRADRELGPGPQLSPRAPYPGPRCASPSPPTMPAPRSRTSCCRRLADAGSATSGSTSAATARTRTTTTRTSRSASARRSSPARRTGAS